MDVSIVIRTKNEAEFIEDTLEKVMRQEFKGAYEVIIIDSGSTDSTLQIVRKHNVKLVQISQEKFTYGRSLNMGAMNAEGNYIVNLSAHALPRDNNWLTNLITGFENDNVAGVYGRQLSIGLVNPYEAMLNEIFFVKNKIEFNLKDKKRCKRIHFTNSNAAIRKDVWQRFKFNEQVPYGEDILWQSDVIKAGFSVVYTPNAVVYHTHTLNMTAVYKNSVNCAYCHALTDQKKQWISLIAVDVALFLGFVPISLIHNLEYIWRKGYKQHAKVAPLWVLCTVGGSLVGRIKYRLKRRLWED